MFKTPGPSCLRKNLVLSNELKKKKKKKADVSSVSPLSERSTVNYLRKVYFPYLLTNG